MRRGTLLTGLLTHPRLCSVVSFLPTPLQSRVDDLRMRLAIRLGHSLVPRQPLEQKLRYVLQILLAAQVGSEAVGDYLDFGVYYGASMACMYRALCSLQLNHVRLFGFDSFQGLPSCAAEEDRSPGEYACSIGVARKYLSRQRVDWSRIFLVQGWFQDTLSQHLADTHSIRHASVIMIDSGLFSSTSLALSFCAPLIGSTCILIFDNWYTDDLDQFRMGEKSAFDGFLSENPDLVAEELGGYCSKSEVFLVRRLT